MALATAGLALGTWYVVTLLEGVVLRPPRGMQDRDERTMTVPELKIVTKRQPGPREDLLGCERHTPVREAVARVDEATDPLDVAPLAVRHE